MVVAFDFLDVMAWDVALSAVLLGFGALACPYFAKEGRVDEKSRAVRIGFSLALGGSGFYLFLTGIMISLTWPFDMSGGVYNVLFGGVASLGGLVLMAGAACLGFDVSLRPVSYVAFVAGVYAVVDAFAMFSYGLTSSPLMSGLGYLAFAAPAFLSVPAAHLSGRRWRLIFAVFAFVFAVAWMYMAASFTWAHLKPA
jgi:putative membrane protein